MLSGRDLRIFGIAQTAFSGSTLLSFMLGAHDQVFATGEAYRLFRRYRPSFRKNRLRSLMVSAHDQVLEAGEAWSLFRRYRRWLIKDMALHGCSVHRENCDFWTANFFERCQHSRILDLYERIEGYSEEISVVVHKFNVRAYEELMRERTPLDGLIVLFKRPVSYYSSHKQHVGGTVEQAAANFVSAYCAIQNFSKTHRLPAATVFYEDLATKPRETLEALCAWMGLTYEPVMTTPWEAADRLHTIGGNVGTYMNLWDDAFREQTLDRSYWDRVHGERGRRWLHDSYRKIKLDDRWKSLPPEEIREMEACTEAQEMFETLMDQRLLPKPEQGGRAMHKSSESRDS